MELLQHNKGRAVLFTLLYASEGGPIGFIWWALPTLLRTRGLPVERITGLTAILVLPWVFKFLWAPLIDSLRTRRWGFKSWIISAQLVMGTTLIPLIWLDPVADFEWWSVLLLAHAFSAATQDVSVDALAINVVPAAERGSINGYMQAGMLLGRSLFGGGALLQASYLGWEAVFVLLIACIWSSLLLVILVREPAASLESRSRFATFGKHLRGAFPQRRTWAGLAFALISAAAFEATGALAGPYLVDRNVSSDTIGLFFAIPVVLATMAGGLIGGRLSDRFGRTRSVGVFLAGFVLMILTLAALDGLLEAAPLALAAALTGMYVFIGLFTAASYALFMDLTDPKLGATQFSAYMAATNGCEAWSGWAGGRIVAASGYAAAFSVMSVVSLMGLWFLRWLGSDRDQNAVKTHLA